VQLVNEELEIKSEDMTLLLVLVELTWYLSEFRADCNANGVGATTTRKMSEKSSSVKLPREVLYCDVIFKFYLPRYNKILS